MKRNADQLMIEAGRDPMRVLLTWAKLDLLKLLASYGTAKGSFRSLAQQEQAYSPGFL